MGREVRAALWGIALGAVLCGGLLAGGRIVQAWGAARSQPDREFRVETVREDPVLERRGSRHLQKGFVIVLSEGEPSAWRCLVEFRPGASPKVLKRLKRLRRGSPLRVLAGTSPKENPLPFPRVTKARRVLAMVATAYDPGPSGLGGEVGITSLGMRARFGLVAVDPKVVAYRSRLYIEGYGPGLAADTGGAIKGMRLDLCYNSTREAMAWGRRKVKAFELEAYPKARAKALLERLEASPPKPGSAG